MQPQCPQTGMENAEARRLRICHVITRMIIGGAQENTLLTVRGLAEKGHHVVLLTGPTTGPEGNLLAGQDVPGASIVELPHLIRKPCPLEDPLAYLGLLRYFRSHSFDVVHTHSSKAGILGRLAARRARVPVVVHTVHGQAFHPYQAAWLNRLFVWAERRSARVSHRILAVAQAMIEQCVEAGVAPREKYRVVYSGMDVDAFRQARPDSDLRARLGIPPHVPVVGKIARLFELKGHEFLIEAAATVVREFPDVRFLLVGDGVLRESLQAAVAAKGLDDNFVFAGLVAPGEVPRYDALIDVLSHLSLREGLPRTVVQALAAGVPAVGFALDGTPEVILDGRTGRLCPAEDSAAVAEALCDLLRNPDHRRMLGGNGQELVKERFGWRTMADAIERHYYECLAQQGEGGTAP